MKNDIDSILDSMFRGGRLHFRQDSGLKHARPAPPPPPQTSRAGDPPNPPQPPQRTQPAPSPDNPMPSLSRQLDAALQSQQQASKALSGAEAISDGLSRSVQESIERLAQEARADMAGLSRQLEEDGIDTQAHSQNSGPPADLDKAFETARKEAAGQVLGQDGFLDALTLAYKRPFVAGAPGDKPLCRAAVLGAPGTGRRSALTAMTASLGRQGVLKSPKTVRIDLSAYNAPGMEKLFVQDLYSALKSGGAALVFQGHEKCHASVLGMVASLFCQGEVALPGRYVAQKGILADIGTALAPGAVSTLSAGGKYLFLVAGPSQAALGDAFGAPFLAALDDLLYTEPFTQESLEKIAAQALKDLCTRAQKQLGLTLSYGPPEAAALAKAYTPSQGAGAIGAEAQRLYTALSEEKLRKSIQGPWQGQVVARPEGLGAAYTYQTATGQVRPAGSHGQEAQQAALEKVKGELRDIVGLQPVKDYILSLEDNFKIQQLRKARGLKADSPSMHMIFTGNPGTGKTTVARLVSRYLKAIGLLSGGQLVEVTRADLVGQYVGHTAPLTQKAIQAALGGVLFIDEAYSLYRGRDDSFGLEAIDALVKGMEDHRESLVVILAGYSREMEEFLTANSGLRSRFPHIIEFPDYSPEELWRITESIVASKGYRLDPACQEPLTAYFAQVQGDGGRSQGNGRMARNKVEQAVIACSRRNVQTPEEARDLELLLPEDFGL